MIFIAPQFNYMEFRSDMMLWKKIMDDDFISENDFIKLTFKDGVKCAVRKKDIISFIESDDDE